MKKFILLIAVFTAGFVISCDDYVDIEPKGQVIPRKIQDLELFLQNSVDFPSSGSASHYMDDDMFIADYAMDYIRGLGLTKNVPYMYGFEDLFFTGEEIDTEWWRHYEKISFANYVLNQIPLVTGSEADVNKVAAKAKVQRAFHYWHLVNQFSIHYGAGDPNEAESGVPIVTQFGDVEESLVRKSIQEVYDFIIQDLNFSVENLDSAIPLYIFQGSAWSAYGLLARTYLHMGNYEMALDNATKALNIKHDLIDYKISLTAWGNTLGRPERDLGADKETMLYKTGGIPYRFAFVPGVGFGATHYIFLTPEIEALYDQAYDTRYKKLTIADAAAGGARKYKGWTKLSFSIFNGLGISEVLMIRAECNARLGFKDAAMDDINYLRENRIDSTDPLVVNLSASTPEEALQHALEEKRRETAFRGVRYFDIKRLNAFDNANISLNRTNFDGEQVILPANDPKWAMPIGEAELNVSPGLKQSPRN